MTMLTLHIEVKPEYKEVEKDRIANLTKRITEALEHNKIYSNFICIEPSEDLTTLDIHFAIPFGVSFVMPIVQKIVQDLKKEHGEKFEFKIVKK